MTSSGPNTLTEMLWVEWKQRVIIKEKIVCQLFNVVLRGSSELNEIYEASLILVDIMYPF